MTDENNPGNRPLVKRRPPRRTRALLLTTAGLAVTLMSTAGCTPQERPAETQTVVTASEAAEVVAVVDGDTIDVTTATGRTARVRLIGIDTPEIGRDGDTGECYATEARDFLDELLYGRTVELQSDNTQADTDRYGRLLRHVVIDGHSAAVLALEAGTGYEYTYDQAYAGQGEHRDAEQAAAGAGAGLWSACS
ncbi:thermonuclease family protein [Microbacterium sp. BF1]|uniref:thermonuclease family protein n=1 Tax=Microbacterium sp. BF1 TaxID=2821146 RepID=UPI001C4E23AB|nr:thermonuclease family protein [Microbacterium sp. BF1]